MMFLLSENFWWPSLSKEITSFISKCEFCKTYSSSRVLDLVLEKEQIAVINSEEEYTIPTITTEEILNAQRRDSDLQEVRASVENKPFKKLNITNIWTEFMNQKNFLCFKTNTKFQKT